MGEVQREPTTSAGKTMEDSSRKLHVSPARELDEWQDWLAELDQKLFDAVRPEGQGIAVGRYGYSLCPETVRDNDRFSVCEPPPSELAYVACRYILEHMEDPWSYLRFWTRSLRLGGVLVLLANDRHWEWIDSSSCWQVEDMLEHLGFSPPFQRRPMEHGFGCALVATKRGMTPEGTVFHSAALERNGRAVLIDGPHGSGKTSVLVRLVDLGWRFLADRFTLVTEDLIADCGMPVLSVRPGAEHSVPQLAEILIRHPAGMDAAGRLSEREHVHPEQWKHRFPVSELPGLEFGRAAPVVAVIFPEVTDDRVSSLQAVSRATAEARLRANAPRPYGHNLPAERQAREATLRRLLDEAAFFLLSLGKGEPLSLSSLSETIARRPIPGPLTASHGTGDRASTRPETSTGTQTHTVSASVSNTQAKPKQ